MKSFVESKNNGSKYDSVVIKTTDSNLLRKPAEVPTGKSRRILMHVYLMKPTTVIGVPFLRRTRPFSELFREFRQYDDMCFRRKGYMIEQASLNTIILLGCSSNQIVFDFLQRSITKDQIPC